MRGWIVSLLVLGILSVVGAPSGAAARKGKAARSPGLVYLCVNCGVGADHSTACPICRGAMARLATYGCPKCMVSSDRPGPCPTCHEPMKYMAGLYRHCDRCGFYYAKAKRSCPVCAKRHKMAHR
jgi:rubrerythrin